MTPATLVRRAASPADGIATRSLGAVALLSAALLLAGCGGDGPATGAVPSNDAAASDAKAPPPAGVDAPPAGTLEAVALELGTRLDADGRVLAGAGRVRTDETVHVSLVTVGEAEAAMLRVQWRDAAGALLAEDERAVAASGPAVHTFSRSPEAGWASGRYEVEVRLGAESAGVRGFEVR